MAGNGRVKHISPMLPAADMDKTLAFYREVLGFSVVMQSPAYSIVERDRQWIHLAGSATEEALMSARKHMAVYLEVEGVYQLWERVKAFESSTSVRAPFARDYGMTEFHILDPNGCLLFFGEETAKAQPIS